MKFKPDMQNTYRVKMRGKIEYLGKCGIKAHTMHVDIDYLEYCEGKQARSRIEYHDGYSWLDVTY